MVLSTWKTGLVTKYVQHLCLFDAINKAFTYTAINTKLDVPYDGDLINPSSHINITAVASSFKDRFYILWKNVISQDVELSVFSHSYSNNVLTVVMLETVPISANSQGKLGDGLIISTKLNLVLVTQKNSE